MGDITVLVADVVEPKRSMVELAVASVAMIPIVGSCSAYKRT